MLGSNYYGKAYFGQGPAEGTTFTLHSISATVTTTAAIAFQILINKTIDATVTTTATISRQVNRIFSATVSTTASFFSTVVEALNIRRATTRITTQQTTTRRLRDE